MMGMTAYDTAKVQRTTTLAFWLLCLFVAASLGAVAAKPAHAATFTVNSIGDASDAQTSDDRCDVDAVTIGRQCTLRAAIQQANFSPGADFIAFNISGNGPHTISPGTELPQVSKPVTIDGYTQGDATADPADDATENTLTVPDRTNAVLKIELHGATGTNYCSGLNVAANNVVIRGLVINNFEFCGSANSSSAPGIRLSGTGHTVEGNFIGTDTSGVGKIRNARGVLIEADASTIGGTSPAARNLISGNVRSGVEASGGSSDNTIRNNIIGPDKNGQPVTESNAVGGGVVITSGTGNRILSNSIFSNGNLGIDLEGGTEDASNVTANDPRDPDTGANRLQNHPEITSAQAIGSFTSINGTLNSTPSTKVNRRTFTIQFFSSPSADPSGSGEGQTFIGQIQVTTNRAGNAPIRFTPAQRVPLGRIITATATRNATGDTSEFSNAKIVEEPPIGG